MGDYSRDVCTRGLLLPRGGSIAGTLLTDHRLAIDCGGPTSALWTRRAEVVLTLAVAIACTVRRRRGPVVLVCRLGALLCAVAALIYAVYDGRLLGPALSAFGACVGLVAARHARPQAVSSEVEPGGKRVKDTGQLH
jgi:peptidoglycan/LPS O-acetylase OafA/YrhL